MQGQQLPANYRDRASDAVIAGIAEFEFVSALQTPAPFVIASEPDLLHGDRPVEQLHALGFAGPAGAVEGNIPRAQAVQPEPAGSEKDKEGGELDHELVLRTACCVPGK